MDQDGRLASLLWFTNQSFRDVADRDYIAARVLCRYELLPQFLWAAHQAVEKYLKAILLYNGQSARGLKHDLQKALEKLQEIRDIEFQIPDDVRHFIARLNEEGPNRYFEYPVTVIGDELLELDRAVWHLRRYAQWIRGTIWSPAGKIDELQPQLSYLHSIQAARVHRFRISGGYLESVLAKASSARQHLVWKNFYYGARKKRTIKFARHTWVATPAHHLEPEVFEYLSSRVDFSKSTLNMYRRGRKQ